MDVDQLADKLAQRIVNKYRDSPSDERILIAVAGVPGSGKSTLAVPLTDRVNHLLAAAPSVKGKEKETAICVGMDGWHYSRAELDLFEDPAEARRRRGAHHTFNSPSFLEFLTSLRNPTTSTSQPIAFPTFDHKLKDPLPSPISIEPSNRIIIIEGLYLLLNLPPWSTASSYWTEKIWLDIPAEVARTRLVSRHLETGVESVLEEAEKRVDGSDMLNGEEIRANLIEPTVTVEVREDGDGNVGFVIRD